MAAQLPVPPVAARRREGSLLSLGEGPGAGQRRGTLRHQPSWPHVGLAPASPPCYTETSISPSFCGSTSLGVGELGIDHIVAAGLGAAAAAAAGAGARVGAGGRAALLAVHGLAQGHHLLLQLLHGGLDLRGR